MNDKKYMLFSGDNYYALGGSRDFCGFYGSIAKAKQAFVDKNKDEDEVFIDVWGEIVKASTMNPVLYTSVSFASVSCAIWEQLA